MEGRRAQLGKEEGDEEDSEEQGAREAVADRTEEALVGRGPCDAAGRRWNGQDREDGDVGDPAHEALNVIRSPRFESLLRSSDMQPGILRLLDIYCNAAQLDVDRIRRWTQFGAVREAMWGRRHGDPDCLIQATDQLAEALT